MGSSSPLLTEHGMEDETAFLATMKLVSQHGLGMAIKAAVELDIFTILAQARPDAPLSAANIAAEIHQTQNPEAPDRLDRLLRFLASHAILRCLTVVNDKDGRIERRYALEPIYRLLAHNPNGVTLGPAFLFSLDKPALDSWQYLKDAVLLGIDTYAKANGMKPFEYMAKKDPRHGMVFNQYMASVTKITSEKIVDAYEGFGSITVLVDVGGGTGTMLRTITMKYPHIKGINFDLPHVVSTAPKIPGVDHVGGDMFLKISRGDAIILKCILHNWNDEDCVQILRNCYEALPNNENGKVIVVENILPEIPERSNTVQDVYYIDLFMMVSLHEAKERTEREYKALAAEVGFAQFRVACYIMNYYVMEFIK